MSVVHSKHILNILRQADKTRDTVCLSGPSHYATSDYDDLHLALTAVLSKASEWNLGIRNEAAMIGYIGQVAFSGGRDGANHTAILCSRTMSGRNPFQKGSKSNNIDRLSFCAAASICFV